MAIFIFESEKKKEKTAWYLTVRYLSRTNGFVLQWPSLHAHTGDHNISWGIPASRFEVFPSKIQDVFHYAPRNFNKPVRSFNECSADSIIIRPRPVYAREPILLDQHDHPMD